MVTFNVTMDQMKRFAQSVLLGIVLVEEHAHFHVNIDTQDDKYVLILVIVMMISVKTTRMKIVEQFQFS
jgi:hypothetical protein